MENNLPDPPLLWTDRRLLAQIKNQRTKCGCFLQFFSDQDTHLRSRVKVGVYFWEGVTEQENIFPSYISQNRGFFVFFFKLSPRQHVVLQCFQSSEVIQKEAAGAVTPNRWNKFTDQLEQEPTLSAFKKCFMTYLIKPDLKWWVFSVHCSLRLSILHCIVCVVIRYAG